MRPLLAHAGCHAPLRRVRRPHAAAGDTALRPRPSAESDAEVAAALRCGALVARGSHVRTDQVSGRSLTHSHSQESESGTPVVPAAAAVRAGARGLGRRRPKALAVLDYTDRCSSSRAKRIRARRGTHCDDQSTAAPMEGCCCHSTFRATQRSTRMPSRRLRCRGSHRSSAAPKALRTSSRAARRPRGQRSQRGTLRRKATTSGAAPPRQPIFVSVSLDHC